MSRSGRIAPLGSSPILERDAFVFFDQSHCRGADMKLRSDATAVVTVGQEMRKEAVMQAVLRMRQLAYEQKVLYVVPAELVSKIRASNPQLAELNVLQSEHLLRWTMHNYVFAMRDGLLQWGSQASHFITTQEHSQARLIEETLELPNLYGGSISKQTVHHEVEKKLKHDRHRLASLNLPLSTDAHAQLERVTAHTRRFGSDVHIKCSGFDEECERELEAERELEKEVEIEIPRQAPALPTPWPIKDLLSATSPLRLPRAAGVMSLADALSSRLAVDLKSIHWAKCGIFVTRNYIETVTTDQGEQLPDLQQYMRPVDALILWKDTCLLLSEWEADQALQLFQDNQSDLAQGWHKVTSLSSSKGSFVNFRYLIAAADKCPQMILTKLQIPAVNIQFSAIEHMLAGLQLLAGDTRFETEARRVALESLLVSSEAQASALALVCLRGRDHEIQMSHLEAICDEDLLPQSA